MPCRQSFAYQVAQLTSPSPPCRLARGPLDELSHRTGRRRYRAGCRVQSRQLQPNPACNLPAHYASFSPTGTHTHSSVWVWLLFCCRACPRPNLFELNMNLVCRRAPPRSRHAPPCLTDHAPPAITLHGVLSGANIEVVPLPDESQIVILGMQASTNNTLPSATLHENLSPQAFQPFCPSWSLLLLKGAQQSRKRNVKPSAGVPA